MRTRLILTALLCIPFMNAAAHEEEEHAHEAHAAHVHGAAVLNVFTEDDSTVVLELDSPMINFISFEHKPGDEKQITEYNSFLKTLSSGIFSGDSAFRINSEAACFVKGFEHDVEFDDGHGDFELTVTYRCEKIDSLSSIEVNLFKNFPALHSISAQVVTEKMQKGFELKADSHIINLK